MRNEAQPEDFKSPAPGLAALVSGLAGNGSVLGVILVGSASRGQNDEHSDYDLQVVTADPEFRPLNPGELIETLRLPFGTVEIQRTSESDFLALKLSPKDCDHWPYQSAKVLFDRGTIAAEIELIKAMPAATQSERVRLHLFEFYFYANRVEALEARKDKLNLLLACGHAARTAVILASVSRGKWPPLLHWSAQELRGQNKHSLAKALENTLLVPGTGTMSELKLAVLEDLCLDGHELLVTDTSSLAKVSSPYYRTVREKFGRL